MPKTRFDLTPTEIAHLARVQKHLTAALGMKVSRTRVIARSLAWLANWLDAGALTQADLTLLDPRPAPGACSLCSGAQWIDNALAKGASDARTPCPRCQGNADVA